MTQNDMPPGSAGVPPASSPASKAPRESHSRGYLPHFDHPGLVQTVTFRLADSLPEELMLRLRKRADNADDPRLRRQIEDALDNSAGTCHLRDPGLAGIVQDALLRFDAERYRLLAWAIMPNHVHVMIETVSGVRLDGIVHSWKSFTAKACNSILRRSGAFWQADYFDRFVRNPEHYRKALAYIEENPVKAGLASEAADWPFGSACRRTDGAGETPALPGVFANLPPGVAHAQPAPPTAAATAAPGSADSLPAEKGEQP